MNVAQQDNILRAKKVLKNADAILVTASNGLSITEGLHLFANNQAFQELLGDYEKNYGFHNLLHGFFYPWNTLEEKWGYYSRVINHYSGSYTGSKVMDNLKSLIGDKPYFIVTSNGEGHFQLAGFKEENIYEVEVSWLKMRCSRNCHKDLYPTLDTIRRLAIFEKAGKVPSNEIPRCPNCGAVMELYETNPADYVILQNWNTFLQSIRGKNFVVLELGIGSRNQLIKAPMMRLVAQEQNASYITINLGDLFIPNEIADKSIGIDGYLDEVLMELT